MKLKFKTQAYQTAAVQSVVDCFVGQPPATAQAVQYRIDPGMAPRGTQDLFADGFKNAEVQLSERSLLENLQKVQRRQFLPVSEVLVGNKVSPLNLDIEMETGTGKMVDDNYLGRSTTTILAG